MVLLYAKEIFSIMFCHICQVAARYVKLVLGWGAFTTTILGEGKVLGGQRCFHSKELWWFPMLSIVTIALSITIRPQLAIESLRDAQINRGGQIWGR